MRQSARRKQVDEGRSAVYSQMGIYLIGYGREMNQLDATFAALADPTRRAILARSHPGEAR